MLKKQSLTKGKSGLKKSLSQKASKALTSLDRGASLKTSSNPHQSPTALFKKQKSNKTQAKPTVKSEHISDNEDSIDSLNPSKETAEVKEKVLKSLAIFKNAANEYMSQCEGFEEGLVNFQSDLAIVKKEMQQVFYETNKSRDEVIKWKKINESPCRMTNLSTKNSPRSEYIESNCSRGESSRVRIKDLKKEIGELKEILTQTEEEIRANDSENNELRNIAFKIQDTIDSGDVVQEQDCHSTYCKECCIF